MIHQRLVTIFSALSLWIGLAGADVVDEFVGQGRIHVLNSTDFYTASLADRIGCLNAEGWLTLNDCAIFTEIPSRPFSLFTSAGNCTMQNPDMPLNTDSIYGKDSHAWWCGPKGDWLPYDEYYYTVKGFPVPFICTSDTACFWDVKAAVPVEGEALPVWLFYWGSQQMDVPPGHWRVLWLWVPVGDDEH